MNRRGNLKTSITVRIWNLLVFILIVTTFLFCFCLFLRYCTSSILLSFALALFTSTFLCFFIFTKSICHVFARYTMPISIICSTWLITQCNFTDLLTLHLLHFVLCFRSSIRQAIRFFLSAFLCLFNFIILVTIEK